MHILKRLKALVQKKYSAWKAKKVKQFRTEEIARTLSIAHATELANTPGEMWPVTKARQAREIAAVRDGDITIVDRRSWQFPYLPSSITRIRQPILKMTPFNIRRFAKSPIPRRALNLIKNGVLSLKWDIVPKEGTIESADGDLQARANAAKYCFQHPNGLDSYQSFMEMNIEDFVLLGASSIEPQITPDPARPFKMWSVDTSTIRIFPTWTESNADTEPHYAQMTGLLGERGIVPFMDDELLYLKDNPTNETPFGLGKMEVAFQSIVHFLGVQEMSGKAGADQLHKSLFWWQGNVAPAHVDQLRRYTTNDLEGQAKVGIIAGAPKPELIEITPVQEADLLLNWQELLIRIICLAFDMSPAKFLERDVNRSTGEVLEDADFRSAVVPVAIKLADGFTRFILHRLLGWKDLEFKFLNLEDPSPEVKIKICQTMYSCNAETGNGFRKAMGMPPLATKFADMTQIELILLNTEAQANIQNANADKAATRQIGVQKQQMQMYQQQQQQQQDGEGQVSEEQVAAASSIGTTQPDKAPSIKAPKLTPPKLPTLKLPLAGCMFNASEIASFSPRSLRAAISTGLVTHDITFLCEQMEQQEPGILDQMDKELRTYLDNLRQAEQEELENNEEEISPKDKADQLKRFRNFQHQQSSVERDYNVNRMGRPKNQQKDPAEGSRQVGTAGIYKQRKIGKLKSS